MDKFEKVPSGIFDKVENNKEEFISKFVNDLEELFPETVKDGIVDFQALLDRFGEYEESGNIEKYNMTWMGKREAIREADEDIIGKTLKYIEEDSKNPETTQNLYIEGDNLEVLKLLRQSYYGKVKMIYIDPPYNTGNDFVYKDDFTMSEEEYAKLSGEVDEYGERLVKNSKDSGRYHSDWLNMMYPRLKVAKDLLKEDGVIFISIDDNEVHNMRKICDEIFGEKNFEGAIKWRRRHNQPNDKSKMIARVSEYIIVYSKNYNLLKDEGTFYGLPLSESRIKDYKNPDQDTKGAWSTNPWKAATGRGGSNYEIITPSGIKYNETWYGSYDTFLELEKENRIHWTDNGNGLPRIKIYLNDAIKTGQAGIDFFTHDRFGSNQDGSLEIEKLFNIKGIFTNPKPTRLLNALIKLSTKENDLILDFFSGSSTTAHAVIDLNLKDNNGRKYIMVQLPELTDEKSGAYKEGYKNIAEIGKERIRRAGELILEENKDKTGIENLDIGFKVFKVEDTNLKRVKDTVEEGIDLEKLKSISPKDSEDFNPHFTDIDVVYEMMLKRQDIELTEEIIPLEDIGNRTYLVGQTILICLEDQMTEEMIDKMGNIETPLSWIILRDSAFDNNINLKLNAVNRLKSTIKANAQKQGKVKKDQKIYWI